MSTPPEDLAPAPVRSRGSILIKTLLCVIIFSIFSICFYFYFSRSLDWTIVIKPAPTPFREMSVDDVMRSMEDDLPPVRNFTSTVKASSGLHSVVNLEQPAMNPLREMSVDDVVRSIEDGLPPVRKFRSITRASSGLHSVVNLEQPRAQYCVGDSLSVLVNMKDHKGNQKVHGGDFILARIHSPYLQASASGEVTDLLNGSYRVRFRLFWPGDVLVSVHLMHSSEAVGILRRISAHNYNKVIYIGTFKSGKKTEKSQCAMRLKADKPLCEYRKKEDEEYYACVPPKTLPCSTLRTMGYRHEKMYYVTRYERLLLSRKYSGIQLTCKFGPVKVVSCPGGTHRPAGKCVAGYGMTPPPNGHFFENVWSPTSCRMGSFFSADAIGRCLKGRTLKLMGDSTVRQWQNSLMETLKGLKYVKPFNTHYFTRAVDPKTNTTVQWQMHGLPFSTFYPIVKDAVGYVYREVDRAVAGDVVVIGVGQHFRPFPLEVFVQRLLNMRKAIQRLHERSPQTLVVIKLENTREFHSVMTHLSDWLGYLQNLAQRKVFRDLRVVLVDAWDMTTAASTFLTHPNSVIVANEIALALSYLCPNA